MTIFKGRAVMLAAIGMFVFETDSLLFSELSRDREWRHARTDRLGALPASQYLGPGADTVSLAGVLVPELAGRYSSIEKLAEMAGTGDAYPLANGTGTIMGHFTIDKIGERHDNLVIDGLARKIDFTIELSRVG